MRAFREAVDARDEAAIEALLADDIRFTSPVAFTPYHGRHITAAILRAVMRVMGDGFGYVGEYTSDDGRDHALRFETTVNGKALAGCDFIHVNEAGKIDDLMVMVRPLSAATALAEAMGAEFDRIGAEAAEAAARTQ
ncbi:nuclear transport factor 2 family protein [Gordonia sp. HY442]|uniref:nuclear transport factor 2 family protein n=1 Tax=Gordonia zhenghanii TaxID=2911516 RepID=UPI001F33AD08|nr:nuclear transport factor 2 family protein [Gordonia zhenghanii]MCF8606915.1 nuclear transport factor 2 family protein [Gordonia zhenghanii]